MSSFVIHVPDEAIQTLKSKLATAKFPDELESEDPWVYGAPLKDVKRLVQFWKDEFDWRKVEAELNELPNFRTTITLDAFNPLEVHYLYQPSPLKNAIPLLFCHGWPGSFIEVKKILPLLQGNADSPAFHVVAPSLPNFGFSSGVKRPGFNLEKYAEVCHKLMLQLGYNEYVTQGGDWGFYITRSMGMLYPQHVKACHINMIRANPPQFTKHPLLTLQHAIMPYSVREKQDLKRREWFHEEGFGYNHLHRTRPQTIGFALADSPVALLAWLYEKLHDWTDAYPWTDEEILTWVSIYWFSTAGPAASVRIYYEATYSHGKIVRDRTTLSNWVNIPLGLAFFPKDLNIVPKTWARTLGPVMYESVHDRGGHFAAWEKPEAMADDLKKMFGRKGRCYGCVKDCDGYARQVQGSD